MRCAMNEQKQQNQENDSFLPMGILLIVMGLGLLALIFKVAGIF